MIIMELHMILYILQRKSWFVHGDKNFLRLVKIFDFRDGRKVTEGKNIRLHFNINIASKTSSWS